MPINVFAVNQYVSRFRFARRLLLVFLLLLSDVWVWPCQAGEYARALPGYKFAFPRDHGAHTDYHTEWWYFTGNLAAEDGHAFGYELTFFRNRTAPPGGDPAGRSPLVADEVYLAHFAISDIGAQAHESWDRIGRAGFAQGSASSAGLDVRMGHWQALMGKDETITLRADAEGGGIEFTLRPGKPLVIHGVGGVHQKSEDPAQASHYISYTRLETSGQVRWRGRAYTVRGLTWMDHEFGSSQLGAVEAGWDWLALQLETGDDLMLYQLRRKDGTIIPNSSGTHVDAQGQADRLPRADYTIGVNGYWTSPRSGARYPMGWTVRIPKADAVLTVTPAFEDQEMVPTHTAGTIYWEGAVRVQGKWRGRAVQGKGYVELVGYARGQSAVKK